MKNAMGGGASLLSACLVALWRFIAEGEVLVIHVTTESPACKK